VAERQSGQAKPERLEKQRRRARDEEDRRQGRAPTCHQSCRPERERGAWAGGRRAALPPDPSLTLLMTRPSSALRAPSPRERGEGELLKLLPLAPRERGEGGRRPGEGRVINASAAHGAVISLGMTSTSVSDVVRKVERRLVGERILGRSRHLKLRVHL